MIGRYAGWGWSPQYPESALIVSSTAARLGLDNHAQAPNHRHNLELLSDFAARLPFQGTVTSGYRTPAVNAAVKGSSSSQHPNGLALDIVPHGMTNREAAQRLFEQRHLFPELDQVIWYLDTSHVHIGICPPGGIGCVSATPRGMFLSARKEGDTYTSWTPALVQAAVEQVSNVATTASFQIVQQHRRRPWVAPVALGSAGLLVAAVVLAIAARD